MTAITIRAPEPADRDAFLAMWDGLTGSDPDEPGNRETGPLNWDRALDPACPMELLIAVDGEGVPQGFALFLAMPFSWSTGDACYLQDLFVNAPVRGQGIARRLFGALHALGRERGWYKVFWMTQGHNTTAQRLYDSVGIRRDHLRYDMLVTAP